mgnify:CR=1 FL=1
MAKRIGVLLSGCGVYDGSEIHEAVLTLLALDRQGRLLACEHDRRVSRTEADDTVTAIAERYQGKRLNSPNDAVFHRNGDLYFTDPPYGLTRKMQDPDKRIPFQGVYRRGTDGVVTLLTAELSRPNGLAFSPDYRTLYVANSDPARAVWTAFPVLDNGGLGDGRVLFDATHLVPRLKGLPDGLKVDRHGNLFATGPGGVLVLTPTGEHLGTLCTGEATSNCAFGEDGRSLFVTADSYLLRIRLETTGFGF